MKNLEIFTKNQLGSSFDWNNVLMIGGGVGACLFPPPEELKGVCLYETEATILRHILF
jgi:hypothetical protein